MGSLSEAANLLRAAADVADNGHASGALRIAEHAVEALRGLTPKEPEPIPAVLARHEFKVGAGDDK